MTRIFSIALTLLLLCYFAPSAMASEIVEDNTTKTVLHKKYRNVGGQLNPLLINIQKLSTFKPFNLDFGKISFSQWETIIVHHKTKSIPKQKP